MATVQELIVGLGLDLADYERELNTALGDAQKFVTGLEQVGADLDGRTFARGIVDGIRSGFEEAFAATRQVSETSTNNLVQNLERVGVAARRQAVTVQDVFRVPNIAATTATINTLAASLRQVPAEAARAATGIRNFGDAMAVTSAEMRAFTANSAASLRLIEGMSKSGQQAQAALIGIGTGGSGATAGVNRLRGGLTALAVQASGTNAAVGQVVSSLLLIGAGTTAVLGVAAGIAVVAGAYQFLTRESRKAKEETDELITSLRAQAVGRLPAFQQIDLQLQDVAERLEQAQERLQRFQTVAKGSTTVFGNLPVFGNSANLEEEKRRVEELTQAMDDLRRVRDSLVGQSVAEAFADRTGALVALIRLGVATTQTFTELRARLAQLKAEQTGIVDPAELARNKRQIDEINAALGLPAERAIQKQRDAFNELLARLQLANQGFTLTPELLQRAQAEMDKLNAKVKTQGDLTNANVQAMRDLVALAQALPGLIGQGIDLDNIGLKENTAKFVEPLKFDFEQLRVAAVSLEPAFVRSFTAAADAADIARLRVEALKVAGADPSDVQAAEAFARSLEDAARVAGQDLLRTLNELGVPAELQADLWQLITQRIKQSNAALEEHRRKLERLNRIADEHAVAEGFIAATAAISGLSREEEEALQNLNKLAEGIRNIAAGDVIGGALQAFSAIAGLLAGGESSRERLLRENNAALKELSTALRTAITDSALLAGTAAKAAVDPEVLRVARQAELLGRAFGATEKGLDLLDDALAEAGLTFQDLQRFAQSQGLSLLDENGKLAADALAQLGDAAELFLQQITQFGDSISAQRQRLELESKLFGDGVDSIDRLKIDQNLLAQLLPSQADFIRSLDLSSQEGQDAYRKLLQETFRKLETNFFTDNPEELRGTIDDFIEIAGSSADALNELRGATDAAVASMTNVPQGFKIALARFNAQLDDATDARLKEALIQGPTFEPRPLTQQSIFGTDGAALPAFGAATIVQGDVIIQVPDAGSPKATAQAVLAEFRSLSRGQNGDTNAWWRLR